MDQDFFEFKFKRSTYGYERHVPGKDIEVIVFAEDEEKARAKVLKVSHGLKHGYSYQLTLLGARQVHIAL